MSAIRVPITGERTKYSTGVQEPIILTILLDQITSEYVKYDLAHGIEHFISFSISVIKKHVEVTTNNGRFIMILAPHVALHDEEDSQLV